jgi:hypothetical protein
VVRPAVPCPAQQEPGILNINVEFGFAQSSDADGNIQAFIPPFIETRGGVEIAFYTDDDHRWFRHIRNLALDMYVRTPRVGGLANALDQVTLTLSSGGSQTASAATAADGFGRFAADLADEVGAPVRMQPGDTLTATAGGQPVSVQVPDLSFDWSDAAGTVIGRAPAGSPVQLLLRLSWGQVLSIDLTADAAGGFKFGPSDVPPRATWDMDDVTAVRVVMPLPGGHRAIDQTAGFDSPGPQRPGNRIYLPSALKQGRAGAAPAVPLAGGGAIRAARHVRGLATGSGEAFPLPAAQAWRWHRAAPALSHRRPGPFGPASRRPPWLGAQHGLVVAPAYLGDPVALVYQHHRGLPRLDPGGLD